MVAARVMFSVLSLELETTSASKTSSSIGDGKALIFISLVYFSLNNTKSQRRNAHTMDMDGEGFKFGGLSMPRLTTFYGIFLILWGVLVSLISGSDSWTSYIPSFLGVPMFLSGVLAERKPESRKLAMHIAASFGILCAIGGIRFFMKVTDQDTSNWAKGSMLMLLVTGSIYTYSCVKSFKNARESSQ